MFFIAGTSSATTDNYSGGSFRASSSREVWNWWVSPRAYTRVAGTVTLDNVVASGATWTAKLVYYEAAIASTDDCEDAIGSAVTTTLCSVSNPNRSCTYDVDLTAVNGNVGIAAATCFQIKLEKTAGSPTTPAGVGFVVEGFEASGDGIATFTDSTSNASNSSTFYTGVGGTNGGTNIEAYYQAAESYDACAGTIFTQGTPDGGDTWTWGLSVSTTVPSDGQSCADLSYNDGVATCSYSTGDRHCAFALSSTSIPAGACFRGILDASGTNTTLGASWGFACSAAGTSEPAKAGGTTWTGFTTSIPTATFSAGDANSNTTAAASYWRNGKTALAKCDGAFRLLTGPTGGDWEIKVSYSNAALGATQSCKEATFTTTSTLCTVTASTEKGCDFANATVAIPANGCARLVATEVGTIASSGGGSWTLTCRP